MLFRPVFLQLQFIVLQQYSFIRIGAGNQSPLIFVPLSLMRIRKGMLVNLWGIVL
jgi:hypothetical protein